MTRHADINPLSKTDRKKLIEDAIRDSGTQHRPLVTLGSKKIYCHVIQVPLNLPIYRIDSSRTWDMQKLRVKDGFYDEGIFELPGESTKESQQAQHEILCEMAEQRANSLFDLFSNEDPAEDKFFIITSEGVLVNGNCRTATLREMVAKGEGRDTFDHVFVAVIEGNVDREQMTKIEMNLQLEDPYRVDYDWIQITTLIQRQSEAGLPSEEVKRYWTQFNLPGRVGADYDTLIRMREELDVYLHHTEQTEEIERIRKVVGYDQLLRTFVESTSKRTWSKSMKDEVRRGLYPELKRAMSGTSLDGSEVGGRNAYNRLRDLIAEVGKHGGSPIDKILVEETDLITKESTSGAKSKVLGKIKTKQGPDLKSVANLSLEDSLKVIKKNTKVVQDKKNQRKNRADKRGVQNGLRLAEERAGDSLYLLKNSDIDYQTEGLAENIAAIRLILDKIETMLK